VSAHFGSSFAAIVGPVSYFSLSLTMPFQGKSCVSTNRQWSNFWKDELP
jgi:hypothetical protein